MGAFLEMPDGSAEWVEEADYPPPLDWSNLTGTDAPPDWYIAPEDDPSPRFVAGERPARQDVVRERLRKQAS